jgi:hypothetical protein
MRGTTVNPSTTTEKRGTGRSARQRHAVRAHPCAYTREKGGTHPNDCVWIDPAERRTILQRRKLRKLQRQARKAQRR